MLFRSRMPCTPFAQSIKGYATETARALMDWANGVHGIRTFVSSTTPDNVASLRVHDKLGFARTGQVVDGEIIFNLRV